MRKKQVEIKKKKSETTLQQTEMDKSHPKFIEMQKLIQCLTTHVTCNTLSNRSDNESTKIAEQNSGTALF